MASSLPGEGSGNPLQRSCLENPRDGGAWWAAVSGVAQGRTRLKQLSSSSNMWLGFDSLVYIHIHILKLVYLVLAALGLCGSGCSEWGPPSAVGTGFSVQWLLLLQNIGARVHGQGQRYPMEWGFWSTFRADAQWKNPWDSELVAFCPNFILTGWSR